MEQLKCDICGGKLVIKSGAVAVCESCGMEYSKECVQEKVQEIKGTVKIAGSIETFYGDSEKERLLKNAETYLSLGKYDDAKGIFDLITKEYPDDYRGWWGVCRALTHNFINPYKDLMGGFDWVPEKDSIWEYYKLAHKCSLPEKENEIFNHYLKLRIKQDEDRLELCYTTILRPHLALDIDGEWRSFIKLEDILFFSVKNRRDINGITAIDLFPKISGLFWEKNKIAEFLIQGIINAQYLVEYSRDYYEKNMLALINDSLNITLDTNIFLSSCSFIIGKTIAYYHVEVTKSDYLTYVENTGKVVRGSIKENLYTLPIPLRVSSTSKSYGCYIATAVYGLYDCPEVWTLRRFRDDVLASTRHGRAFIKTYYAISPTLVKWFGDAKWFNRFWKRRLDMLIRHLHNKDISAAPYQDK